MKIRAGFVSNSSSSSYIICVRDKNDVCPHCGRSDLDIEDYFSMTSDACGDTSLQYSSKENILGDIDSQIRRYEKEIKDYAQMEPNEVPESNRFWDSTTTVKEHLVYAHTNLQDVRNRRDKIAAVEGTVIGIEVGYHDEAANTIFQRALKIGAIEIIEGD